jgi:hypothetical protein
MPSLDLLIGLSNSSPLGHLHLRNILLLLYLVHCLREALVDLHLRQGSLKFVLLFVQLPLSSGLRAHFRQHSPQSRYLFN